ncbi:T9SS type A sorting domain-containing protein [Flaviaesturariibacter amylovorans]|uniref:T9SS type A sorting domain-containing protein n=1 Tax=Flaviaesturariibacter amylovorans TaxID=1084520 RepID=A0ABP8HV48_9BACT
MRTHYLLLLLLLLAGLRPAAQLAGAEYFFNTDPGPGNGTPIAVTPGGTLDESVSIATTGLAAGTHWLYVRSRHTDGRWSHAEGRRFVIADGITAAEYFFDTDPGVGSGTALPITPGATLDETHSIATTGLSAGTHILYVRTRNTLGQWSLRESRAFSISESITAAEYYIDNDPGAGLGTAITVTPGGSIDVSLSIPAGSLPAGTHRIFVRSRNSAGQWSLVESRSFTIPEAIAQAEYYFDTDPGQGNGQPFSITADDSITLSTNISVSGLSGGWHDLFIRSRSNGGAWGIVEKRSFFIKPTVVSGEFYVDADPGPGSGLPIAFAAAENAEFNGAIILPPCTDSGTHRLHVRTRDENGHWSHHESLPVEVSAPVNPGIVQQTLVNNPTWCKRDSTYFFFEAGTSRVLARVTTSGNLQNLSSNVFVRNAPFVKYDRPILGRSFLINADNPTAAPMTVRLYFTQAELDTLNAMSPLISGAGSIGVYQYEGPTEDSMLSIGDATYHGMLNNTTFGQEYDAWYVEFTITHFSEFWLTSKGFLLPAVGLDLSGESGSTAHRLQWRTLQEHNTDHFTLERSANGQHWSAVARIAAAGESSSARTYRHSDPHGNAATLYYRIRLTDRDGRQSYSNVIVLRNGSGAATAWRIAPNPVTHSAMVSGPAATGPLAWKIIDASGRTVRTGQWNGTPNGAYRLDASGLAAGSYHLLLQAPDGAVQLPFLKQ